MKLKKFDLIVVGSGIVGAATFYKWQKNNPSKSGLMIEKEKTFAKHQSGRNSGVIHSGIYYKPGSLKSELCIDGYKQLIDFAKNNNIEYDICGKLIIAENLKEKHHLVKLYYNSIKCGLKGVKLIDKKEINTYQKNCSGISALYVPQTGVIDFIKVTEKLIENIRNINFDSKVIYNTTCKSMYSNSRYKCIQTTSGLFYADQVVVCAGINSDNIAIKDKVNLDMRIFPFRGDYDIIKNEKNHLKINKLIYPTPRDGLPFLGVHITKKINGEIEVGPNAILNGSKNNYSKYSLNIRDISKYLMYKGFWKFLFRYRKLVLTHGIYYFKKINKRSNLTSLYTSIKYEHITKSRSGIRAQAINDTGNLVDDFEIRKGEVAIHVINAPSPAATASMAIADYINQKYL